MKEWKCKSQTKSWYYYKSIFGIPDLLKKVRGAHRVLRNTSRTFGWIHSFNICEIIQTPWVTSADSQGDLILNIKPSKNCWLPNGLAQRQLWSGVQKGQRIFPAASFRAWALGNKALTGSGSFKGQIKVKDLSTLKAPPWLSVVLLCLHSCKQPAWGSRPGVQHSHMPKDGHNYHVSYRLSPAGSLQARGGQGHRSMAPLHGLAISKDIPRMWPPRLALDHATGYAALLGNRLCFCPLSFLISC